MDEVADEQHCLQTAAKNSKQKLWLFVLYFLNERSVG
jgi:hypothetical protein